MWLAADPLQRLFTDGLDDHRLGDQINLAEAFIPEDVQVVCEVIFREKCLEVETGFLLLVLDDRQPVNDLLKSSCRSSSIVRRDVLPGWTI